MCHKGRVSMECCADQVVHANPELQEIMRRFVQDAEDAVADAADKLYYHFHVPVYINPTLREGVTLVSCGKLVLEMGMTMHLDRAPGGSYALSPADEVTGVRLQFELQWGGGTGLPFDVLLNAPELQVDMQPADAVERARETWQIVRVLHQRAQEQLAVNLAAREEEAYSLWGSFAGYVDYASPDAAVPISHDFFDGSASACFSAGAAAALACSAAAYAVSVDHPVACMCARSQEAPVESDEELLTFVDCVAFEEACADAELCGTVVAAPNVVRLASEEACVAAASRAVSCGFQQQMGSVTNQEAVCEAADPVQEALPVVARCAPASCAGTESVFVAGLSAPALLRVRSAAAVLFVAPGFRRHGGDCWDDWTSWACSPCESVSV